MGKKLIFGHSNPDTDAICSALVMEKFGKNKGCDVEAVRLGKLNKETKYVFDYLGIESQRMIEEVEDGQEVILVDHNEFSQSVKNIENAKIHRVVDHHRISNFETSEPLFYIAEPVGCTSTILYKMFKQENMEIEYKEAVLMLSAIISDTLLFKSPTCTQQDKEAATSLAKIANIDLEKYGMDMLKAGTDLSDLTAEELINLDAKQVMLKSVKAKIAQVNTVSIEDMLKRKDELEEKMNQDIENNGLDFFMLAITDIVNSNSEAIILGNKAQIASKAYNVEIKDNLAFLPGVVSRKKQIIPVLTESAE